MIGRRSYAGDAIDASYQYITERPELDEEAEDVVYATEPEPDGTERAKNVPVPEPDEEPDRPAVEGQTTLDDWGWSA
ncbi:hypothetical protein [Salinilacihabitans rarus]|uniref:hypothetical protein n=1 Tax=Salinilacihabitans rarus TaxID=2961596 RepID=UPI0020C8DFE6|nr:hypothetical protein [Salinilacihabitans rarus]